MSKTFTLHDIPFEWDQVKAENNWRKHRITFETACEVFFDPFLRPADPGTEGGEQRLATVGMTVAWQLLFVVYVERSESVRIISARQATSAERKSYEDL